MPTAPAPQPPRASSRPSLATRARAVLDEASVAPGEAILVACSGGLDSQVLLDVLAHIARSPRATPRIRLFAHGVDHGLRSAAREELALAASLAASRGVPFATTELRVPTGSNVQARARAARYDALRIAAAAVGATRIATAHHLDDRAETVLIRVLRGAPLSALAVLPPASGELLRPLVRARRCELREHASKRAIPYADDPSNADRRFVRARVRHDVLPLLRALDPRIVEHLARLADECAAISPDPLMASIRAAVGEMASGRALELLHDAARSGNSDARVRLRGGATAAWDQLHGLVISSSSARTPGGDDPG